MIMTLMKRETRKNTFHKDEFESEIPKNLVN